ncbi:MAG: glycosyltransferase family 4 protein [Candidatus Eisenbacteria bacterium]|nr:glycosyltransferase family 4 protein [Candidatus Eisenbacteria bacterium]
MRNLVTIAYDLRYAADHFTGIGTHAWCLIEALLELPGEERYVVLWDPRLEHRRYDPSLIAAHPRVTLVERRYGPLHPLGPVQVGAWLRKLRPDVYLSPFFFLPVGAPCPCVLTIHDLWPLRMPGGLSPVRGAIYRWSLERARRARFIITSSEFSRREIVELMRMPGARVTCIRLGTPTRRAAAAPRRPLALPDGRYALVVGDNRPRKNLDVLAHAWAAFGEAPPLRLVSAGPVDRRYPSLPELAARARARGVVGLGWVNEGELEWLYAHADLVLFPSLYEGFGFPLVEAFDRGLAAVAADIPTLREIGSGGARLVAPDSPEAWAGEVRRLAADRDARTLLGEAGRRLAAGMTYGRTAEATLRVLRDAVAGGRAA